ncbi:MAG: tetratricopeptide repeat protein [Nitrospirae bacterium]|nr:tetratricopeptide repeat protein [Nitrospirota bacterium]
MSMEEIEKLRERVERDPDSKLFLPLAEEYRKAGMYEEAIEVLEKGLQRQPGYTSAKVALGKIYLEQGRTDDARAVFEEVALTVPDNIFVKKKLVEIYRAKGDNEKAKEYCKKVLELNPMDEEIKGILEELLTSEAKTEIPTEEPEKEEVLTEPPVVAEPSFEEPQAEEVAEELEDVVHEEVTVAQEFSDNSISFDEEPGEQIPVNEDTTGVEQYNIPEDDISFQQYKDFSAFIGEEIHEPEDLSKEAVVEEGPEEPPMFALPEETTEKSDTSGYGLVNSSLLNASYFHLVESEEELIEKANELIRSEQYMKAFDLYAEALRENPDNARIRQRIEELKQLMKLLGKDINQLVQEYEKLLKGIKERKDEFFRGP